MRSNTARAVRLATVATVAIAIGAAAVATAAGAPAKGEWNGKNGLSFEVNPGGTKIVGFRQRCTTGANFDMKIKPDGTFSKKGKISLEGGGRAQKVKISGKFTSPIAVSGTVRVGRCSGKFAGRPLDLPQPAPTPEPPEPQEPAA